MPTSTTAPTSTVVQGVKQPDGTYTATAPSSTATPTTTPTVLTNANITDTTVPNDQQKLATATSSNPATNTSPVTSTKIVNGVTYPVDANGNITGAGKDTQGNFIGNPTDVQTLRTQGGTYTGNDGNQYYNFDQTAVAGQAGTTAMIPGTTIPSSGDPAVDSSLKQLSDLKTQMDATSAAYISSIQSQYESLINQQTKANAGAEDSINTLLLRGGSARTGSGAGIAQAQVSDDLSKIADLQTKENQAVIAAQQAGQDNDFKLLNQQLSIYDEVRKEKQAQMDATAKTIQDQQLAEQQRQEQATRDKSIFDAISSTGSTDPAAILKAINANGDTDITAADIKGVLDTVAANTNSSLDKLTGDTKDFYLLQSQGILPTGVSDLASYLQYINAAKQTPGQALSASLSIQQKSLAIQRTGQLIESAKALEAARIVGPQVRADKGVQTYLTISPMIDKLSADEAQLKAGDLNQSVAQSVLDGITQIDTGGKQITEGQIGLINDSKSYADQAKVLLQKISGQGGTIDPKIAQQSIDLAQKISDLYKNTFQQRVSIYNNRLKSVNGQDLTQYSPLTDITNLSGVLDGSYENALSGDVQNTQGQVNDLNAQSLLDSPPSDVTSYDPSMWNTQPTQ